MLHILSELTVSGGTVSYTGRRGTSRVVENDNLEETLSCVEEHGENYRKCTTTSEEEMDPFIE